MEGPVMRAVVTRVKNARVEIDGRINGKTDGGFLVLLGVAAGDTEAQADKMAACGSLRTRTKK